MILDDGVRIIFIQSLTTSSSTIITITKHKLSILHPPSDEDIIVYVWLCQQLFIRRPKSSMNWCWWQDGRSIFTFLLPTLCWHDDCFRRMNQDRYSLVDPLFRAVGLPCVAGSILDCLVVWMEWVTHPTHQTPSRTSAVCSLCATKHTWFYLFLLFYYIFYF